MIPKNPYRQIDVSVSAYRAWRECFAALIVWLFSPCTEHPVSGEVVIGMHHTVIIKLEPKYPKHRYQCPDCMEELKESNNA